MPLRSVPMGRKVLDAVVVGALAAALAGAVILFFRWDPNGSTTQLHILNPPGRMVSLRVNGEPAQLRGPNPWVVVPDGRHQVELWEDGRAISSFELETPRASRRVLLPVGRQCFEFIPRHTKIPLQRLDTREPWDLARDMRFHEEEMPGPDPRRRGALIQGSSWETNHNTWLLVKAAPCGGPSEAWRTP